MVLRPESGPRSGLDPGIRRGIISIGFDQGRQISRERGGLLPWCCQPWTGKHWAEMVDGYLIMPTVNRAGGLRLPSLFRVRHDKGR